jgi:hypothetical protein
MYSRNMFAVLTHLAPGKEGRLVFDMSDEITRESCATYEGRVIKGGTAPVPASAGAA